MSKKALVVSGTPASRIEIGNLLGGFGMEITHALGGAEAVRVYEEDPSYDVVVLLMDIGNTTPGINGYMAAKMIRGLQRAKKPFVIGVGVGPNDDTKAKQHGIDYIVNKAGTGTWGGGATGHDSRKLVVLPGGR